MMAYNVQKPTSLNIEKISSATQSDSENDLRTLTYRPYSNIKRIYQTGANVKHPNFSGNGEYMTICDYSNDRVVVYRNNTFNIVKVLSVTNPRAGCFDRNSEYLFIGKTGGVECYDVSDWSQVSLSSDFEDEISGSVKRVICGRDNNYLFSIDSASPNSHVVVFDISDATPSNWSYRLSNTVGPSAEDITVSHNNDYYATIDHNGVAYVYEVTDGSEYAVKKIFDEEMGTDMRFSEYDEYIYWAAGTGTTTVTPEITILRTDVNLSNPYEPAYSQMLKQCWSLDISRDGRTMLIGAHTLKTEEGYRQTSSGTWIVDLRSENLMQVLPPISDAGNEINDCVFSPSMEYIAYTNYDSVIVWGRSEGGDSWIRPETLSGTTTSSYTDALEIDMRPFDEAVILIGNTDPSESLYFKVLVSARYFDGIEVEEIDETSLSSGDKASVQLDGRWGKATIQVKDNTGNADYTVEWNGGR